MYYIFVFTVFLFCCVFVSAEESQMNLSDSEWKNRLTPDVYAVTRQGGTERPFSGKYLHMKKDGTYVCACCGAELFKSDAKFDSGTGWPSFSEPSDGGRILKRKDTSHGMIRTEVLCANCGAHLGHVFDDGPGQNGERYCINSLSLDFDQNENTE